MSDELRPFGDEDAIPISDDLQGAWPVLKRGIS